MMKMALTVWILSFIWLTLTQCQEFEPRNMDHCNGVNETMKVYYDNSPMWTTPYNYRFGIGPYFYESEKDKKPLCVNRIPWKCIPLDSFEMSFVCDGFTPPGFQTELNNGNLNTFIALKYLGISGCNISHLSTRAVNSLKRLTVLQISNSPLKSLDHDVFEMLPQLVFLRLVYNEIQNFSLNMLCKNSKLFYLQLHNNTLTRLSFKKTPECEKVVLNSIQFDNTSVGDSLENEMFQKISNDGVMSFDNVQLKVIPVGLFKETEPIAIDLSNNLITEMPFRQLAPVNNTLIRLKLTANRIQSLNLSLEFFNRFLPKVAYLELENNKISNITGTFSIIHHLKLLRLSGNEIPRLEKEQLAYLSVIQEIDLQNNMISTIHNLTFTGTTTVTKIDLSYNKLDHILSGWFSNMSNLLYLNISHNNISYIEPRSFNNCKQLLNLDLSYNAIQTLGYKETSLLLGLTNIIGLYISHNKIEQLQRYVFQTPRLQNLSLDHNNIFYIENGVFRAVNNTLVVLQLHNNKLRSPGIDLQMRRLERLDLHGNKMDLAFNCSYDWAALTYLDMSDNKITQLPNNTFCGMHALTTILLHNNSLHTINVEVFKGLSNLTRLTLAFNDFICDSCDLWPLQGWIKSWQTRITFDNVTCLKKDGNIDFLLSQQISACENEDGSENTSLVQYFIVVPISFVAVFVISVLILRYRYQLYVIVYYKFGVRLDNVFCWKYKLLEPKDYIYDAFVCFSQNDDQFVINVLQPFLEPRFKLCIHYRDFEVGEYVAENILQKIEQSARIIIVLSEAFLRSHWGLFEFKQAHFSTIQHSQQKLIVIVMEQSVLKAKLDIIIRSIIRSKTYLSKDDRLFWQKLLYQMPHYERNESDIGLVDSRAAGRGSGYGATETEM